MSRPISSRPLRWITYLLAIGGLLIALSLNRVSAPEAHAASSVSIFALTTNNTLVQFNSATPGTIISTVPITGIVVGENIVGIDFRPATGQLFAAAFNGASNHVYVINPNTGVAMVVTGTNFTPALSGTNFGFDFNPVADRIRVVADSDQNLRLNPSTGLVVTADTPLAYASGDPHFGANPNVVGAGYTNNIAGTTTTTLYVIDSTLNILARQGGVGGTPSANTGQLTTIGLLGFLTSPLVGLDIAWDGTAYASLTDSSGSPTNSKLFTINLTTGAATFIGTIGGGATGRIRDLAVRTLGRVYLPIVLK
jgi:hypothetical protein